MKKICTALSLCFVSAVSFSQQTTFFKEPNEKFNEAKEYFQKEQYSLAYPLFKELQQSLRESDKVNLPIEAQEINYYTVVSALKQNEGRAEQDALEYIDVTKNNARAQLWQILFFQNKHAPAIVLIQDHNTGFSLA